MGHGAADPLPEGKEAGVELFLHVEEGQRHRRLQVERRQPRGREMKEVQAEAVDLRRPRMRGRRPAEGEPQQLRQRAPPRSRSLEAGGREARRGGQGRALFRPGAEDDVLVAGGVGLRQGSQQLAEVDLQPSHLAEAVAGPADPDAHQPRAWNE